MKEQIRALFCRWGNDDEQLSLGIQDLAATYGKNVYQETLRQLTAKTFDPETACHHWQQMLLHRDRLFPGERPFSRLRPALLDYLHMVAREIEDPRIVEAGHLENMRHASVTDGLTGLYHQTYFKDRLDKVFNSAAAEGNRFAIVLLDLDHFKQYNDCCGHLAGDHALKLVADLLLRHLRQGDMACRYGGEEFALLLRRSSFKEAYELAEQLRLAVEEASFPGQHLLTRGNLTVSAGIAIGPENAASAAALLAQADEELYRAKEVRNSISPSLDGQRRKIRHHLQSLVEFALSNEEFQPGLTFDISSSGLSFGCGESIAAGTILNIRFRKPFWPQDYRLHGTVRNVQQRDQSGLLRVGLEFADLDETLWVLLPARPIPAPAYSALPAGLAAP